MGTHIPGWKDAVEIFIYFKLICASIRKDRLLDIKSISLRS